MSILLPITPQTAEMPPGPVHRFTVEQYHQLADLGILGPEDRVELLEGWIVEKMNHRPAHGYVVGLLTQRLFANLPEGWIVNLVENQLEQFSDSDGVAYRLTNILKASDMASIQFDSHAMQLELGDVLGQ
jgi:hypothetical protein